MIDIVNCWQIDLEPRLHANGQPVVGRTESLRLNRPESTKPVLAIHPSQPDVTACSGARRESDGMGADFWGPQ